MLSCLLLLMIGSMALPLTVQNRLLRLLLCSACRGKPQPGQNFSYINVGLYKTRNAVCRREVYQQHVWGNGGGAGAGGQQQPQEEQRPADPERHVDCCIIEASPAVSTASSAFCAVPICIESAQKDATMATTEASTAADLHTGHCWPELQCQHPAVVCDAMFCYRSDPNIRQSAAAAHNHWPVSSDEAQQLLQQHQ
ncbi:hypothetical protein BOX15_Mlig003622g1 [Macrostomum lignano]|nr:hypothetical protein BOX15_Mlig003622g1 [Macrostomum lignano]